MLCCVKRVKKKLKGPRSGHCNQDFESNFEFTEVISLGSSTHHDFRKARPEKNESSRLKIVTYNIEMGMELEGIIKDLQKADADILLLQEVDVGTRRNGRLNTGAEIAQKLELNYYFCCRTQLDGGYEGNAVLTKFDFESREQIKFNCYHSNKKHKLGHFCPAPFIKVGKDCYIRAASVHLDPFFCGKLNRIKQLKEVLDAMEKKELIVDDEVLCDEKNTTTIIGGDFNTVCTGAARLFYPEMSTDFSSVFGSLFCKTEAQVMDDALVKKSKYFDPFYKGSCGLGFNKDRTCKKGSYYSAKLDWVLFEKDEILVDKKEIIEGASDHMMISIEFFLKKYLLDEDSIVIDEKKLVKKEK